MSETPYAETEVLVAIMNGDHVRVNELLADFFPHELKQFEDHANDLRIAIHSERAKRDE